jgi:hypothetical protein
LSRSATDERKSAIATTSLLALPGWREKRRLAAITEATAARPTGPVPYGRPMQYPANRARPSQAMFISGERKSLPKSSRPPAWSSSETCG